MKQGVTFWFLTDPVPLEERETLRDQLFQKPIQHGSGIEEKVRSLESRVENLERLLSGFIQVCPQDVLEQALSAANYSLVPIKPAKETKRVKRTK